MIRKIPTGVLARVSAAVFLKSKRIKHSTGVKLALSGTAILALALLFMVPVCRKPEPVRPPQPRFHPAKQLTIHFNENTAAAADRKKPPIMAAGASGDPRADLTAAPASDAGLSAYFRKIADANKVREEDIEDTLENMIAVYTSLHKRLGEDPPGPNENITALAVQAREALSGIDLAQAEKLLSLALEKQTASIARLHHTLDREKRLLARVQADIGDIRYARLDYQGAKRCYRQAAEAVPEQEKALLAGYQQKWGQAAFALGHFNEAQQALSRALETQEALPGKTDAEISQTMKTLALSLQALGRYADAERLLRRIIAQEAGTLGRDRAPFAAILSQLAHVVQAQGRLEAAETLCREILVIDENTIGTDHIDHARHVNVLAAIIQARGRPKEAELLYRKAIAVHENTLGFRHPETAVILNNLAGVVGMQGRFADAETMYLQALAIDGKTVGENHPQYVKHLNNLAALLQGQDRYEEAESLYRKAAAISNHTLGPDHPQSITIQRNLKILLGLKP